MEMEVAEMHGGGKWGNEGKTKGNEEQKAEEK